MESNQKNKFLVIAVGASAGGLEAFVELIGSVPEKLNAAIVFVQHLPSEYKTLMPGLVHNRHPDLDLVEIDDGMTLQPQRIYFAPGGRNLSMEEDHFRVEPSEHHQFHAIDSFFRSFAHRMRERAVGVILSGAGSDGTRGAIEIRSCGGSVIAQDPTTARFPSMPRSAIEGGCVDLVLAPKAITEEITKIVGSRIESFEVDQLTTPEHLKAFFDLLFSSTGYRFHQYKKSVVQRRVRRRMQLHGVGSVEEYIDHLKKDSSEARQLAADFMIGVTSFFRDPGAWQVLKKHVVRTLVLESSSEPVRVWTPACSTGEESYSIAAMLHEELERAGKKREIQVFATDINDSALEKARRGVYVGCLDTDIPSPYMQKYFFCSDNGTTAMVNKEIRDSMVFAKHDILSNPPFSKLDLIICRNLLIYLELKAQKQCIDIFHYALVENGYLFLGKAETVSDRRSLFKHIGPKDAHIYQRLPGTAPSGFPTAVRPGTSFRPIEPDMLQVTANTAIIDAARNMLLETCTPAAVAIDTHGSILYNSGAVNRYLTPPQGAPTRNLFEQLPARLHTRIKGVLYRLAHEGGVKSIRTKLLGNEKRNVSITISCLDGRDEFFLVVFRDVEGKRKGTDVCQVDMGQSEQAAAQALEDELKVIRTDLQQKIEQVRTINEELQSSNEELLAANEELETSREELQSLNEELVTVNAQLQSKITEQEETNDDLVNFQKSTNIPALFLGRQFRVRRFTEAMTNLVKLIPSDIGRPLQDLSQEKLGPELFNDAQRVLDTLEPVKREVAVDDAWYIRSVQPYRTADNRIMGVVVTFSDVSGLKKAEEKCRDTADKFRIVADFTYDWEYWRTPENRFVYMAPSCERITGYRREEFIEDPQLFTRIVHPDDRECTETHLTGDVHRRDLCAFEFRIIRRDGQVRWMSHACQAVVNEQGQFMGRRSSNRDITDRKLSEMALADSEARYRELLETANSIILRWSNEGKIIFVNEHGAGFLGYISSELVGRDVMTILPEIEESTGRDLSVLTQDILNNPEQHRYELTENIRKDGTRIWVTWTNKAITNEFGNTREILAIGNDITELKRAEGQIAEKSKMLTNINTILQEAIRTETEEQFGAFCVDLAIEITGSEIGFIGESGDDGLLRDIAISGTGWEKCKVDDTPGHRKPPGSLAVHGLYGRILNTGESFFTNEPTLLSESIGVPEGYPAITSFLGVPLIRSNKTVGVIALGNKRGGYSQADIETLESLTPSMVEALLRKRAEAALRENRKDLKRAQAVAHIGNWRLDIYKNELVWSDEAYHVLGISPGSKLTYETFLSTIHPDDKEYVNDKWIAALNGEPYDIEHRIIVDGAEKWVREQAEMEFGGGGKLSGGFGTVQDITEQVSIRKQTEQAKVFAEKRAREAEEGKRILDALLEHVPEGIIITEGVGKPVTISRMLEVWTGNNMRDGIGFGTGDFIAAWGLMNPQTRETIRTGQLPIMRVLKEGIDVIDDIWLQQGPDGTLRYLSANAGPITDRDGNVVGCVVAWRDVTDAKTNEEQLKRSEEHFRTLADNMSQFAWMTDSSGWIFWYNKRWFDYTGTTLEEMQGWEWTKVHHPDYADRVVKKYKRSIDTGTPWEDIFPLRSKEGEYRWFLSRALPIRNENGEIVRWFGTNTDITDRQKVEEALRQRTEELVTANKELESFSYSVSHDLRAPLRAMIGFSQFLLEDYSERLDDEGKDYLHRIKKAGEKMSDLIDDILILSRVTRQEMVVLDVDLSTIAKSFVAELRHTNPDRSIDITVHDTPMVKGDSRLLRLALKNLVRNAWKYTGKNERPFIEIGSFEKEGKRMYFVKDNGVGFNMAQKEKLFIPFQRLHTESDFPGTGIGLAIVERVIRRHGGRVWAEAEEGKGATFYFTLYD